MRASDSPSAGEAYQRDSGAIWVLAGVSAATVALLGLRLGINRQFEDLYLVWNLFLAWMPLWIARYLRRSSRALPRSIFWMGAAAWLLFFPNAPYILTDLIHLPRPHASAWWTTLVLHLLFALSGLVAGFLSLRTMQGLVIEKRGSLAGSAFVVGASLLAGLGIYIGRVERWNSWDVVVNPIGLLSDIPNWLNLHSIKLALLFSVLVLGAHVLLWALVSLGGSSSGSRHPRPSS